MSRLSRAAHPPASEAASAAFQLGPKMGLNRGWIGVGLGLDWPARPFSGPIQGCSRTRSQADSSVKVSALLPKRGVETGQGGGSRSLWKGGGRGADNEL